MKSVNVLLIEQASGESRHIRHVLESSATMSYSVDQVESLDQALARLQGTDHRRRYSGLRSAGRRRT